MHRASEAIGLGRRIDLSSGFPPTLEQSPILSGASPSSDDGVSSISLSRRSTGLSKLILFGRLLRSVCRSDLRAWRR
uniref:Uncharacterized protein n=1 Tax=Rodentolepis nana TaxID=102285 RepID=A0A158QIT7_RODNA